MSAAHVIAIVDDDDLVRSAMGSLVRALGYRARVFASAAEYLEADTGEVACVVSDVQMPDVSGIQLLQRLRQRGAVPPVVLMTAFPEDRLHRQAAAAGAAALVEKPVDGDLLLELFGRIL